MTARTLQKIVGRAIISDDFRAGILNGKRAEILSEFDLEHEVFDTLMSIRAESLAEFAAAVEQLVRQNEVTTVLANDSHLPVRQGALTLSISGVNATH